MKKLPNRDCSGIISVILLCAMVLASPFCWAKFPKKKANFETKFPKHSPEIRPEISSAFLAGREVFYQTSPESSHHRFQVSNQISTKSFKTHTSAGMATLNKVSHKWVHSYLLTTLEPRHCSTFVTCGCGCASLPARTPRCAMPWRSPKFCAGLFW